MCQVPKVGPLTLGHPRKIPNKNMSQECIQIKDNGAREAFVYTHDTHITYLYIYVYIVLKCHYLHLFSLEKQETKWLDQNHYSHYSSLSLAIRVVSTVTVLSRFPAMYKMLVFRSVSVTSRCHGTPPWNASMQWVLLRAFSGMAFILENKYFMVHLYFQKYMLYA